MRKREVPKPPIKSTYPPPAPKMNPMKLYTGEPYYKLGRNGEPEYHKKVCVKALDKKEAREKIITYCFELNSHTHKSMWDILDFKEQGLVNGVSLEKTIKTLENAGIPFIDIE